MIVVVINEDGIKMIKVRIFFDSGSYCFYVINDLKLWLNFKFYKIEMLNLNIFGE